MSKSILIKKQLLINHISLSKNKQIPIELANIIKEYLFYDEDAARKHVLIRDIMSTFSTYFLCTSRANPNGLYHEYGFDISVQEEVEYASNCEHWIFVVTNFDHRYYAEVDMRAINCAKCGEYIACQTAITVEVPYRIRCFCQEH
jgi:hypothetical protein